MGIIQMSRATVIFLCIVFLSCPATAGQRSSRVLSKRELGEVLHCLVNKMPRVPYREKPTVEGSYCVRYWLGKHDSVDEPNELHLLIYHRGRSAATLYELYFEKRNGRCSIELGIGGTFLREGKRLVADDVYGGQATHARLQRLVDDMAKREQICIPLTMLKPGRCECEAWE